MSAVLLGAIKRMTYASEIINHVTKKSKRRLILVLILTAALIFSNLGWVCVCKNAEYTTEIESDYSGA